MEDEMKKEINNHRRSFLVKLVSITAGSAFIGNMVQRFVPKKKAAVSRSVSGLYPIINPMAVARKKDKA